MPEMTFRPYAAGDERAILDLFEKSYARKLPLEYWRWRFADNSAGPAVIFLAWSGDVLAAHYAVSRVALSINGSDVASALSGTTMTHPDFRGMGLFPELARRTYDEMARLGMSVVWGFPNANSHRGFIQDLGWRDIYEIPTMRRAIDVKPLPDRVTSVAEANTLEAAAVDALWQRIDRRNSILVKRDARYVTWRFAKNPSEKYRYMTFADGANVRGYAVFKRYKDEMQIVDILGEDASVELELVNGVAAVGRKESATSIALWMALTSATHRAFEKASFQVEGPVTYLGARVLGDLDPARVYSPFAWQFAMSDSDVY